MANGHFMFLSPVGGLGATHNVHLKLIEKLPISVNWTFFH